MESLRGTGQAPLNLFHPSTIPSTSGSLEVAEQMVEGKGNQSQAVAVPNVVRSGYKHYRNGNEPGTSMFITSTIIDFVMVFAEHQNADLMAVSQAQTPIAATAALTSAVAQRSVRRIVVKEMHNRPMVAKC